MDEVWWYCAVGVGGGIDEDLPERIGAALPDGAGQVVGCGVVSVFGACFVPVGECFGFDVFAEDLCELDALLACE